MLVVRMAQKKLISAIVDIGQHQQTSLSVMSQEIGCHMVASEEFSQDGKMSGTAARKF